MLKEKLLKALGSSSTQNPVDSRVLTKGRKVGEVRDALNALLNERKVCCCKITRNGQTKEVWWITGRAEADCNYNQTIRARKKRAAMARLEAEQDGD